MTDNLNIKPENQSQHNQSKPLTDDQEIGCLCFGAGFIHRDINKDPHTGEILPREDGNLSTRLRQITGSITLNQHPQLARKAR